MLKAVLHSSHVSFVAKNDLQDQCHVCFSNVVYFIFVYFTLKCPLSIPNHLEHLGYFIYIFVTEAWQESPSGNPTDSVTGWEGSGEKPECPDLATVHHLSQRSGRRPARYYGIICPPPRKSNVIRNWHSV